jgi:thioredoxin-like negative regulator of GroEL
MTPIVEAVAQAHAPKLRVLQIDSDANPAATVRFGVRGLPTLLVFRDGEVVDRIIGAVSKAVLMERLARVMAE